MFTEILRGEFYQPFCRPAYGFFFAPIVFLVGLTFANTALPRLLGLDREDEAEDEFGLHRDQLRLDDF